MWICIHCGQANRGNRFNCWKCSAPKNKTLATEPLSPAVPNNLSSIAEEPAIGETGTHTRALTPIEPPYSADLIKTLRLLGIALALIAIVEGFVILANTPEAPSVLGSDDLLTQIQRANRMSYLILGWTQIVGGTITGLFLYVVAGIGDAVLDLWKMHHEEIRRDKHH